MLTLNKICFLNVFVIGHGSFDMVGVHITLMYIIYIIYDIHVWLMVNGKYNLA